MRPWISWLEWLAAFLLWLVFVNYARHYLKEFKWQKYGVYLCSAALIGAVTYHLTKPGKSQSVSLYYRNSELEGQMIDATLMPEGNNRSEPGRIVLQDIRAETSGRFPTEKATVILYFSDQVMCEPGAKECHPVAGRDGFLEGFLWNDLPPINPKETWSMPVFKGTVPGSLPKMMKARLKIFYGEAIPAEATFTVSVQNLGTE